MRHMINIFLLTVLALVVIAVFAVSCHKEPEKVTEPDYMRYEFGTGAEIEYTHDEYGNPVRLTGVSLYDRDRILAIYGVPAELLNDPSKVDHSGHAEARKKMIEECVPPDFLKAYNVILASEHVHRARMSIMLRHLTDEFNHKPKL